MMEFAKALDFAENSAEPRGNSPLKSRASPRLVLRPAIYGGWKPGYVEHACDVTRRGDTARKFRRWRT